MSRRTVSKMTESPNALYYGDNLAVLREHIKDESVDLIYLDPPFNSKRDYNLLFKTPKGQQSEAQITAFEDTWHWATGHDSQAEREYDELLHQSNTDVAELMKALRSFLGENDMMAYLVMMANRLLELHRVLKPTGSLYLHCDPTASHYLKIVLDGVFGKERFINEIVWKRTTAHSSSKKFAPIHDIIFYYGKTNASLWNDVRTDYKDEYLEKYYKYDDGDGQLYWRADLTGAGTRKGETGQVWRGFDPNKIGRHWTCTPTKLDALDAAGRVYFPSNGGMPMMKRYREQLKGKSIGDIWDDVDRINPVGGERLGYPTQKPLALLDRIISASSTEGDVILDPFCGCGTAVHAAQKLKRRWVGIDVTCLAIGLIERRLKNAYPHSCKFVVHGTPKDLESAHDLAKRDKYQFQWWAVTLVDAQPYQGKKKGADGGIDGIKFYYDMKDNEARKIVVSVKGGEHLKADDIRALNHVREREKADIAILISLNKPTAKMKADAASVGYYEWQVGRGKKSSRIQLFTIEDLLNGGLRADHPDYQHDVNYKKAKREAIQTPTLFGVGEPDISD